MSISHIMSAGMCGMRTAGDLVAWMQLKKGMKINDAKQYVAEKLGLSVIDLSDEDVMRGVREELDIGTICAEPDGAKGMLAKTRIAKLLDIEINSVNKFYSKINAPLK
jgi:hypothetical protein